MRILRPALVIVLETEIWPNLYFEAKRAGACLGIVNGRFSDRSWPRYRRWKKLFCPIIQLADLIFVQSAVDRDRYLSLGAPRSKLHVEGNLKYDASLSHDSSEVGTFGAQNVWIAASTAGPNERGSLVRHVVDEDDLVIRAFEALASDFPGLLLILAPRQPARFNTVAQKLDRAGLNFVRRTAMKADPALGLRLPGVLLLDTIGELSGCYSLADVVFLGGSIAPRGGHNIIEPAAAAAPVVIGPHMENFEAITRDFSEGGGVIQIDSKEELLPAVRELLLNHERAMELGARAQCVVNSRRGVSQRIAVALWRLYQQGGYTRAWGHFSRAALRVLAFAWRKGGEIKRRRSEQQAALMSPLPVPVVSIGGITVGGSGKTPFTTYLAGRLAARGYSPAILTRGYRRRSPARNLVFAPGTKISSALTGDEAQVFLRSELTPIGIGASRYETAKILLAQFPETDLLILDDGFQHAKLARDLDIVLIDGLDPYGHEDVVPAGRLREPLSALARAGALVVTRAEWDLRYEAICARLREYNASAPIFRTRLIARHWRDYHTGACRRDLERRRVGAFCGLGNPQNFWNTLESLGLEVVFRWAFDDHHIYKPSELQRIAHQARMHGAEILVTTEKDRVNCPSHLEDAISPFDLAWLEIELELENEGAFFQLLEQTITRKVGKRLPAGRLDR